MYVLEDDCVISDGNFLWKYLDFLKFLYLIQKNKIYFSRLDQFDDPFEGLNKRIIFDKYVIDQTPSYEKLNPAFTHDQKLQIVFDAEQNLKYIKEVASITQIAQFASCWYLSKRESRAMWDIYCDNNSIALRFPANYLVNLIKNEAQKYKDTKFDHMIIGNVNYQDLYPPKDLNDPDYNSEKTNKFSVTTKDSSYSHENEFRFVANRIKPDIRTFGVELDFPKLSTLDFHIITHPKIQDWKFELLQIFLEPYDLHNRLTRSSIPTARLL
jgi:hypothetical protein